jgi:hypothetical protein
MAGKTLSQVEGLDVTLNALRLIDPTFHKEARKRIRKVPAEVQKKTKARVPTQRPMRNWGSWSRVGGKYGARAAGVTRMADVGALRWDATAAKGGIKLLTGGQRLNVRLINKSASGAVFEMAGSKNDNSASSPGRQFNDNLKWFGAAPRLLIATWREEKGIKRTASEMGKVAKFAEERVNEVVR